MIYTTGIMGRDLFAILFIGIVLFELISGKASTKGGGIIRRTEHPWIHGFFMVIGIFFSLGLLLMVLSDFYHWQMNR
jgi:hypothetical protein